MPSGTVLDTTTPVSRLHALRETAIEVGPKSSGPALAGCRRYEVMKRSLDVTISIVATVLLLPLILCISLAVGLTSHGPILYRQTRVGKSGRLFSFFKFRSMYSSQSDELHRQAFDRFLNGTPVDANARDIFKLHADPRITPVGRLLRRTSLDELPQLWNVLRGEMSLVGPRPPITYEVSHYRPRDLRRLTVTPGITGLWQVKGRNRVTFEEMVALDLDYIAHRSILLDLKIMLATIAVVLRCQGAG